MPENKSVSTVGLKSDEILEVPVKVATGEGPRATHCTRPTTELLCIIITEFITGWNTYR